MPAGNTSCFFKLRCARKRIPRLLLRPPPFPPPSERRPAAAGRGQGKIVTEEELRVIVEQYDLDGSGTFDEVRFASPGGGAEALAGG